MPPSELRRRAFRKLRRRHATCSHQPASSPRPACVAVGRVSVGCVISSFWTPRDRLLFTTSVGHVFLKSEWREQWSILTSRNGPPRRSHWMDPFFGKEQIYRYVTQGRSIMI
ncbi:unnamed protein product [Ixodes persulcatus]